MIEISGPFDKHVEQISLPVQIALLDQIKCSLDDKQKPDHALARGTENPVYVKGWRLRLLSLGSVSRSYRASFADN